jgi:TIGR03009 family protein
VAAILAGSPDTFAQVARTPAEPPAAAGRNQAAPGNRAAAPADRPPAQAGQPPAAANDPRMKAVLREWERRSAQLKSLDVRIKRLDQDPAWNEIEQYEGRAVLQSPNLACLEFKKVVKDPKDPKKEGLVDHERIVCTGSEVWQYKYDTRQIFIFPLDREQQKRALEEGPLPFLFNMRAADAEARYIMNVVKEEKDYFWIRVLPLIQIDRESFSQAYLKLGRATYLPERIRLYSPNGKSTKDFLLHQVHPNERTDPRFFQGVVLGKPWKVERNPGGELAPRGVQPRVGDQAAPAGPRGAVPNRR